MSERSKTSKPAEEVECAYRAGAAAATKSSDGTWEAHWEESIGQGLSRPKTKAGFSSKADALAFARKLELVARLNRC